MRARLSGLRVRVILTYLVVFLVSAAIMAGRTGSLYAQTTTESAVHDLEVQAFTMASVMARQWAARGTADNKPIIIPQLPTLDSNLAQDVSNQVTVLDPQGNALVTSLRKAPFNQSHQPEVIAALTGKVQYDMGASLKL